MTWRKQFPVLVPDVHAVGNIAVIRSLGRAEYPVHACAQNSEALGLRSSYVARAVVIPPYTSDEFLGWLRDYVATNGIRVIVPSEGFLQAVRPVFVEFQPLMPVPEEPEIAYRAFSKIDVTRVLVAAAAELNFADHLPSSLIVEAEDPVPTIAEIEALGGPFFLKSDMAYCRTGDDAVTKRIETAEETREELQRQFEFFRAVLVQGWVGGVKAAAAFCLTKDRVLTRTGVLGLRTNPHRGGVMSLRKTWHHEALSNMSLSWLRHIGWLGVAMVECKWDAETDRFWLIEINSRYWQYLHLDLFTGVDVPRIQVDAFLGRPVEAPVEQRLGVRCRHAIPGDVGHLVSKVRDTDVDLREKVGAIARFAVDFLDPTLRSDLLFPGDRMLFWLQVWQFVKQLSGRLAEVALKGR